MSRYTFGNIFPTWLFLEKRGLTPIIPKIPAFAGMTWENSGVTWENSGMIQQLVIPAQAGIPLGFCRCEIPIRQPSVGWGAAFAGMT